MIHYTLVRQDDSVFQTGACGSVDEIPSLDGLQAHIVDASTIPAWRMGYTMYFRNGQFVFERTLAQAAAAKWEEIKAAREAAEFGGFAWDGSTFDSDALSQQRIAGAVQLASLDPTGFSIDWTLADNTVRTLNAQEMTAVGVAMGQHVNAQHAKARLLRQQIEAATTEAELDAIVW